MEIFLKKSLNVFKFNSIMSSLNKGLTVGELTIAISALIVAGLIWGTIKQKEGSQKESTISSPIENLVSQDFRRISGKSFS